MKRTLPIIALILVAALPSTAFALDMDFYTYDGFTETVNAFKRISLVFANNQYTTLFAVAVVLGLLLGGLFTVGKGIINFQQSATGLSLSWLMTTLIGVAVFKALITPTGTVHVYDPVRNAYEAVPDVPDLIVLVAGMTNKAERAVQEIVDASAAHPYGTEGMGVGFELLLNATSDKTFSSDYYLQKSIRQYFKDCSKLALVLPSYAVDLAEIKSGTDDLLNQLADMKSPAMFTTMYSSGAGKAGTVMSCSDAYDNVLAPALNAAPTYDEHLNSVCTKTGFDIAVPAQKTACETKIQNMNLNVFGAAAAPPAQLLRNVVISNAIASVMLDENPDAGIRALTNRSMVNNGLGIAVSANEWMPKIRASVTAIVLGLIPILALFIVTPLFPMALKLIVALLGWIMLWGVMDVILAQIAVDQAYDAVDEIQRHNMGLSAMFLAPESATQALALFGKARGMGITISAFIAAMLFKMSPYGLTSLAGNWSGHADGAGSDAANKAQSPVESMNHLNSLASARGSANLMAETGWNNIASVSEHNQAESHYRGLETMSGMADLSHTNPITSGKALGAYGAGGVVGGVAGAVQSNGGDSSPEALFKQGLNTSNVESQVRHGAASGRNQSAATFGMSVNEQEAINTAQSVSINTGNTQRVGTMLDRIAEQHPDLSRGQIFEAYATATNADLWGKLSATNWHPGEMVKFSEFSANMNQSELRGMMSYMAETGQSPSQIYEAVGSVRAASDHGTALALDEVTPQQLAVSQAIETMKRSADGQATYEQGMMRPGGMYEYLLDTGRLHQSAVASNLTTMELMSDGTGMSMQELVLRDRLASAGSFSMSKEEMQSAHDENGWFTQRQIDAVDDGARVTLALDNEGNIVHSSALSGNNAASDNHIRKDRSYTETDTTRIETGGRVELPNAAHWALSKDPADTARLADQFQKFAGDGEQGNKAMFLHQLTSVIDAVNSSNLSENVSVGGAFQAGLQTPLQDLSPVHASAMVNAGITYADHEDANMNRQALEKLAESTWNVMESYETQPGSLTPERDAATAAALHFQDGFQKLYSAAGEDADARYTTLSEHEGKELLNDGEEEKTPNRRSRSNAGR